MNLPKGPLMNFFDYLYDFGAFTEGGGLMRFCGFLQQLLGFDVLTLPAEHNMCFMHTKHTIFSSR
jgi:hypothetical protein